MGNINTHEYWDNRFATDDWEAYAGDDQSAFFSKIAIVSFPTWLTDDIKNNPWSISDWGCAEGGGTSVLSSTFPTCSVTGYDFSDAAISKAMRKHSVCNFQQGNIHTDVKTSDIIFSSNTLEHIENPMPVMDCLISHAKKYAIFVLPFEDNSGIVEHVNKFTLDDFPSVTQNHYLEYLRVIDCRFLEKSYFWYGKQILLVYTNEAYKNNTQINAKQIYIRYINDLESHIIREQEKLRQSDKILADMKDIVQVKDKEISEYKNKNTQLERVIDSARQFCFKLLNSKTYRLAHIACRLRWQFIKGSGDDRRKFIKWFMPSTHNLEAKNHTYNPLYTIIDILNSDTGPTENNDAINLTDSTYNLNEFENIYNQHDIIILSVISYKFRHQRPQHFAERLAKFGHRVFYINADFTDKYSVTKLSEDLYEVCLDNSDFSNIYALNNTTDPFVLYRSMEKLIKEYCISDAIVIVDYPHWLTTAEHLKEKYGFFILTDYMDDFTGFLSTTSDFLKDNCLSLLRISNAILASSDFLFNIAKKYSSNVYILRNGTDSQYFHLAATKNSCNTTTAKVIGYYGAISDWFDAAKIYSCAERFPDCQIILVGEVTLKDAKFTKYKNIELVGEVPYRYLVDYLSKFDVCLIPFDSSINLIKATNPVKFYEYLSAGKKIVATEIPELLPYKDKFVYLANNDKQFCDYVELCLQGTDTLASAVECYSFAQENDWNTRTAYLAQIIKDIYPKISVVILCYNQLEYTKQCVESIFDQTAYPNFELVLVDNNSNDGTAEYLRTIATEHDNVKIVLNSANRGFAGGNNDGIDVSDGEYIVLLNNDTLVTRGWLTGLLKRFNDNEIGIVGPVTNSIGNEARINVQYSSPDDMPKFAYQYTMQHMGENFKYETTLAMFCIMFPRHLMKKIGKLDENYGIGMFEDDDYCMAAKKAGYKLVVAEDVFIHHFGSVSFKKLTTKIYKKQFSVNKAYYENKWKIKWEPHHYRPGVK